MAAVDDFLRGLLEFLGPAGILVALFLVFVIDAMVIPALPELAFVVAYSVPDPPMSPWAWGALLVGLAIAGEAVGNTGLYLFVQRAIIGRGHMPKVIERLMNRYVGFLVLRDERIILLNRLAPIVPFVGAFIAACRWDYRKSIAFVVLGAAAKYSLLLFLVAGIGLAYDPGTARWVTVGLVLALVAASAVASLVYRRRHGLAPRGPA